MVRNASWAPPSTSVPLPDSGVQASLNLARLDAEIAAKVAGSAGNFTASKGAGAYLNDRRLRVSRRTRLDETLIALGLVDPASAREQELEIMKTVDEQLGAVARPAMVRFVNTLPKTRSGKLLRRAIQAVCEGRDPGDLTTMDDPAALQQIKDQLA